MIFLFPVKFFVLIINLFFCHFEGLNDHEFSSVISRTSMTNSCHSNVLVEALETNTAIFRFRLLGLALRYLRRSAGIFCLLCKPLSKRICFVQINRELLLSLFAFFLLREHITIITRVIAELVRITGI